MATKTGKRTTAKRSQWPSDGNSADKGFGAMVPSNARRRLHETLHPARAWHIAENERKWVNGTTLHYYFFNRNGDGDNGAWIGSSAQKAIVRKAFQAWKDAGIGLEFCEVPNRQDAELRIGFQDGGGCWSYVGRDAIDTANDTDERTMNFSGDLTASAGWKAALCQVGCALGFRDPECTLPGSITPKTGLPDRTAALVQRFYPPLATATEKELLPGRSHLLPLAPGQQADFRIRPQVTRPYTIQLFGACDAVMVLFEELNGIGLFDELDGETEFLAGCDNSGTDDVARLCLRLHRDREYVLRIRLYFRNASHDTAVLVW